MFREQLEPIIAQQLLGDKYIDGYSYVLLSSRDKFVVCVIDTKGEQIDEITLEQDTYTNEDEIEPSSSHEEAIKADIREPLWLKIASVAFTISPILLIIAMIIGLYLVCKVR